MQATATHPHLAVLFTTVFATGFAACSDEDLGLDPVCNPLAVTSECLLPFPTRVFTAAAATPTGQQLALPEQILPVPNRTPEINMTPYNRADGVSPVVPILVHFGVDVAPQFLFGQRDIARSLASDAQVALVSVADGSRVPIVAEMDQNLRSDANAGRHALIIRPMTPLEPGGTYAVVITKQVTDIAGQPLPVSKGFAALRDDVETIHDTLEKLRPTSETMFTALAGAGFARDDLHLAFDFVVASRQSLLGPVLHMRQIALAAAAAGELSLDIDSNLVDPNGNLARAISGTFTVPSFLTEENELAFGADGLPQRQAEDGRFPFAIIIPARANTAPVRLGVLGHGIFGAGQEYLLGNFGVEYIQPLAQRTGTAVVATDWIGLSQGDLNLVISEVIGDLNRVRIVTDRLVQSLVNNLVLTELALDAMANNPDLFVGGQSALDPAEPVGYYGVSLGGIQGSSFISLSPRITRAVLSVPGSSWSTMLSRSSVFQPIKLVLDGTYPDPLLQQEFVSLLQGLFDLSDPINVTRLLYKEPLPDAPAQRTVVWQEAIGDCQVPNIVTGMLMRAVGAKLLTPAIEPVFGLPETSAPTNEPVLLQIQLPDLLAIYTPPDTNTVPDSDNNTHFQASIVESAVDQLVGLLETGEIIHPCDGACDPD